MTIEKLNMHLKRKNESGLIHDSRQDSRILIQVCNELINKVNELVKEVNLLKGSQDTKK